MYLRHEQYGKSYVPLKWSKALADEARAWAEQLAEDCELYHDPNTNHGENIALNYGWDEYSTRRTTENVLSREFMMHTNMYEYVVCPNLLSMFVFAQTSQDL